MLENEIINKFKENGEAIAKSALAEVETKINPINEELKSLKAKNAELEEKLSKEVETNTKSIEKIEEAINKGFASATNKQSKKSLNLEEKSLEKIAKALINKDVVKLDVEESKAIRFSDATTTGDFIGAPVKYGEIDVNKQVLTNILQDIDILPAIAKNDGDVAWDGYDESLVDIFDANEMDAAGLSEAVKKSEIKLNLKENKAKMIISTRVIQDPSQVGTLDRNLMALSNRYERKLASKVYNDVITAAIAGNVSKFETTTADAPADAQARLDLRLFPTKLKVQYVNNAVVYISRTFVNALFSKEVSDGHLPLEQIVFNNGINAFFNIERNIPIRVFEHAQIGNYKSLADGTTDITADYVDGGENTGKLLAFVGDLKLAYKLVPSSFDVIGYDASFNLVLNGSIPAGRIGYAAQGIVAKEAIKVLYAK